MTNSINYWSISSQILEKEAIKLGLDIRIISKSKNTFYISGNGKEYLFKSTDFGGNSSLASKISKDKKLTYKLLDDLDYPIAKSLYLNKKQFNTFDKDFIKSLKFPVIIKPFGESHGNGVMMNINNYNELYLKLKKSFEDYDDMIIQKQIDGKEFRILVVKGEVILVLNRIPPYVIGDGTNSIDFLIDKLNINPKRGTGYKNVYSNIVVDEELLGYILKQGLNLDSVIDIGDKINLRGNSNLGTGGTGKCYTDIICEETKKECIDICDKLGFEICGIDIITNDISKPLKETGGIILELNDNPGLGGDLELTGINTGEIILKKLFF